MPELDLTRVCIGCGAPMEFVEWIRPGESRWRCSAACGAIGAERLGDLYVRPQMKKPNVKPYHESPYRGGKLHV